MSDKKDLLLLFDRPGEPIFTPKGKENAVFQVPSNFIEERFQAFGTEIESRFGDEADVKIPVMQISGKMPDLSVPMQLDRQDNFSLFIPKHRKLASALTDIFLSEFSDQKITIKITIIFC
jgi:tyrosinase